MAFKMKGNPMQRNYGIGAPTKKTNGKPSKDTTAKADPAVGEQIVKDAQAANQRDNSVMGTISRKIKQGMNSLRKATTGSTSGVEYRDTELPG